MPVPPRPLKIAVFGVGAVGGLFGGKLARTGHEVTFIARGETLAALRQDGLRVDSIDGDFSIRPARATDEPAEIGTVDLVLLGVKAWQVRAVAPHLRPLLAPQTAVLPLQNGVEAPDDLKSSLDARHVLGGLCKVLCFRIGPAHLEHAGVPPSVALGELDNTTSERVERIREAFERAGVAAEIPTDIEAAMWQKLLMITAVSGVGAAARVPIGEIRDLPASRRLLEDSIREVLAVAAARGVELPPDQLAATMAFIDGLPANGTASMQRDILDGLPSELEAQTGSIVRMAAAAGVDVPVSRTLYGLLAPLERRVRR